MVDSESTNTPNQESQHTTNKKQRKAYEELVLTFSRTGKNQNERQLIFFQMAIHTGNNTKRNLFPKTAGS